MRRAPFTSPHFGRLNQHPKGQRPPLQQPGGNAPRRANSFLLGSKRGRPLPTERGYGANQARPPAKQAWRSNPTAKRPVDNANNLHPPRRSQHYPPPRSYADIVRKGQPSKSLLHFPPKPKPKHWQDSATKPTASFWQAAENSQKEWIQKRSTWSLVQWVLRARHRRWRQMASQNLQERLLHGVDQIHALGVIYALVLHKRQCAYIGQTVNSAWHRFKQHIHGKSKSGVLERQLQKELQKCPPRDITIIPLEVVPMPQNEKQGHHSREYIEEFRRRALPREQQWIRSMQGANARILNVVKENPKTRTQTRRQRRQAHPQKSAPKATGKANEPPKRTKWITVEDSRLVLDSTTPGDFSRIRKSLALLLQDQEQGRDPIERLTKWTKAYRRDIILFLMDQLDEKETNHEKSKVLFKFLSTAEDAQSPPVDQDAFLPNIDTSPQRQLKKDKANETLWLRIPWSRHDFQRIKLDQIIQSKDSRQAHPISTAIKQTRVSYSLNRPLRVFFSNVTQVCQEIDGKTLPSIPSPEECPCRKYRSPFSLTFNGHVVSTDSQIFKDPSLRQLWQCGGKYRIPAHPSVLMPDIKKGLDEYCNRLCKSHKIDIQQFEPWQRFVIHSIEQQLSKISNEDWLTNGGLTQQGHKELRRVQNDMVVGPCDKSSHDLMFICKHAYVHALQNELMTGVYEVTALTDDQIWDNHAKFTEEIGRLPVKAHAYLYGAAKMHKDPANMRWIAGCARQPIEKKGERTIMGPATSISPLASALGAILRFCMTQLEQKDIKLFRPKGIRRYWIVTSVDAVARHIKTHQKLLAQEHVFTEDFTTMYTKLPHTNIKEGLKEVVTEAFDFFNTKASFNLKWDRDGKAEVAIDENGTFCLEHVIRWISTVIDNTYIKPSPNAPTRRQAVGVPMGGKCSSEIANLYCYYVESRTIDTLLTQGAMDIVKSLYHTFRYIDDTIGFGANQMHLFPYNMEHRRTNDNPNHAIFLGMSIDTSGDFVKLKLQPKGAGWKWTPQRYVEWSSVHTAATKRYLLKGLLVRASTVTNTTAAFHEAIEYYVQGLHARGSPRRALHDAFQSYIHDYWTAFPYQQQELSKWFQALLSRTFGPANTPKKDTLMPMTKSHGALLCGLDAINHIMVNQGRMPITRDILDDIADNVASLEVAISDEATSTRPHAEGYYHITVMTIALKQLTDLFVHAVSPEKWTPTNEYAFILGNGRHWQALVKKDNQWWIRDKESHLVYNLHGYLIMASRRGVVLALTNDMPASGDMDWEATPTAPTSRKRPLDALEATENESTPCLPCNISEVIIIDGDVEEPDKKARALENDQAQNSECTPELLLSAQQAFDAMQVPQNVSQATPEETWTQKTVGVTPMLQNDMGDMYKCINCDFKSASALGVATHYGRYCSKKVVKQEANENVVEEEDGEDII